MQDALGQRGEAIFTVLITQLHPGRGPIFKPLFMGDKWPHADFMVQLEGANSGKFFFFVQVKTTRKGMTKREKRLRVGIAGKDVAGLTAYPAPTYIVGIDELNETGYIVSCNGENLVSLASLDTAFPINKVNRELLWSEVEAYWSAPITPKLASVFVDTAWR